MMNKLPDDIIYYNILSYLNYSDIYLVNKKCYNIKKEIIIEDKFILNNYFNITHLILKNIKYPGYICSVLKKKNIISSLKLINCHTIKNYYLSNIQELYIKNCKFDSIDPYILRNPQLTQLYIIDDLIYNFEALSRLKNLTHLYLGEQSYNPVILYYISKLSNLEYLYVNIFHYSKRDINHLKTLKKLKICRLQIK